MSNIKNKLKLVFKSGIFWSFFVFIFQYLLYLIAILIVEKLSIKEICPKIDIIDDKIPLIPIFIIPYIVAYPFWIYTSIKISTTTKEHFFDYIIGLSLAHIIGFIIFIVMPTYIDRINENLYNSLGNDIFSKLLRFIYNNDGCEKGHNLFPSFHCLISFYCILGVFKQKQISKFYRIFTYCMSFLIVISTLFTKQHYFLDTIGGLVTAILAFYIVKFVKPTKKWILKENNK